jgi:peptidoglycan hydrolase-like protein with peptidoglycan-binding domain
MRLTTALAGTVIGAGVGVLMKRDPWKYALWGGGIALVTSLVGGANLSLGGFSLRVGADGVSVFRVQTQLNQLGFRTSMNGVLGPDTVAALKQFQSNMGLVPDGTLSSQTLGLLQQMTMAGPSA